MVNFGVRAGTNSAARENRGLQVKQVVIENPILNPPFEVPAVNNHGGFGRWAFVEVGDPWDAMTAIRKALGGEES